MWYGKKAQRTMAKRRANRSTGGRAGRESSAGRRSPSGGVGQTAAGLVVVAAVLAGGTFLYRHTTGLSSPAAASAPSAAPSAPPAVRRPAPPLVTPPSAIPFSPGKAQEPPPAAPLSAAATAPRTAPFGTSEEVFEGGARLYAANCAGCHGRPGQNAKGPAAAQFWDYRNTAGSRAITQPVGVIYQATAAGNLLQGMPAYGQHLTDTQLWDLALLIKSAHEDLPNPVLRLLQAGR